ncbi:TspO and MBR related proteins [Halogranum gelatinilyticum]|uniref:TspO and MBR related proteins n=1 Tax=Halogranum gelatinilyticum TaxID=660521 RepID=A0A1G9PF96_9EURY|nr:TspO/MBR family protein [Halogranum gelatinilyticum]SDL97522.1 TspO and MBR related proteins [Halogranum gelatinilyticum]
MELTRGLPSGRRDWATLVGFVVLVNIVGAVPAVLGGPNSAWFAALDKPWFYPPPVTFGVVWTLLFTLMGIAVWRVWNVGIERQDVKLALGAFVGQFVFNVAWTPAFFTLQRPVLALWIILALVVAVVGTIAAFARVDRRAAALLVPYLLWGCFATVLNYSIVQLNGYALF